MYAFEVTGYGFDNSFSKFPCQVFVLANLVLKFKSLWERSFEWEVDCVFFDEYAFY